MLFCDFDWNQVLMKGLIGGIVGGLVGAFVWIGKKATGTDKKGSDSGTKD